MSATVDFLPIWKKDSTAEEWLLELAAIARKYPERFNKVIIFAEETKQNGNTLLRNFNRGATINELIGISEIGKSDLISDSRR